MDDGDDFRVLRYDSRCVKSLLVPVGWQHLLHELPYEMTHSGIKLSPQRYQAKESMLLSVSARSF
jgi:hypothetical protein